MLCSVLLLALTSHAFARYVDDQSFALVCYV